MFCSKKTGACLDVEMGREPVVRLQRFEDFHRGSRTKSVGFDVFPEELFLSQQIFDVAVIVNSFGPVVAEDDVRSFVELSQTKDVHVSNVVHATHARLSGAIKNYLMIKA